MSITVSTLYRYPIKSSSASNLKDINVLKTGFDCDRKWALFDETGQAMTGRQYQKILDLRIEIDTRGNGVIWVEDSRLAFIPQKTYGPTQNVRIFSNEVEGVQVHENIDKRLSDLLSKKCSLLEITQPANRPILEKHGGKEGDYFSFADQAPILLLSQASVDDLNGRLDDPIHALNFRPNIVVEGCDAFAEDSWKSVSIGECEFEVLQLCERCIFTTIDIHTKKKRADREPLKTLETYRRKPNGGVDFGIHLVARKTGKIKLGDSVRILA